MMNFGNIAWKGVALAGLMAGLSACQQEDPNKLLGGPSAQPCPPDTGGTGGSGSSSTGGTAGGASTSSSSTSGMASSSSSSSSSSSGASTGNATLDSRVLSYTEALRTAAIKLVGRMPTLAEIEDVRLASDQKAAYEKHVDAFMNSPRFTAMMIDLWKNTFRSAGMAAPGVPNRNGAPHFAAQLITEGRDYRQMFTATSGTCPTVDAASGVFTAADCPNGPITAGVLSDEGLMYQYASALGFRRTRFIQETFTCRKLPAEYTSMPVPKGNGTFTSPWPFESIADTSNGGRIAFQDTTAAICANCHTTMNHRTPIFAAYDMMGKYVEPKLGPDNILEYSVFVPVDGSPMAKMSDYLVPGETTAWKFGKPAANVLEFGQQMAADDEVARCAVVRMWNYGFSKGDAVYDLGDVPDAVIGKLVDDFKANGYNLRNTLRAVFVHDDFVRY
jgi:hypothetical protein